MVGHIAGKISPTPVGFFNGTIHIIPELGGTEKGLLARLPILNLAPFGLLENPFVNETFLCQILNSLFNTAGLNNGQLRRKHILVNIECGKVTLN